MWGIRRNVDGFAAPRGVFLAAKYKIDFVFQQRERLLEIVTVRGRPAAGRYHHIDQAIPVGGIFAGDEDRIGIANYADMADLLIVIHSHRGEFTTGVVRWHRGNSLL
jgi:hypothetical protein